MITARYPLQQLLARVSRQSRVSLNSKGDNEMVPGAVHRSAGIYLIAEENPGKPQLGDRLRNAVRPVIASNVDPFFEMTS